MRRRSPTDVQIIEDEKPIKEAVNFYLAGEIQVLELEDGSQMLINKNQHIDKKKKVLAVNFEATFKAKRAIFGPVVILKGKARWDKTGAI